MSESKTKTVTSTVGGGAVGTAGALTAVSSMGSVGGLSAAGMTSGLAALGGVVGGGMAAGIAVTCAAPLAVGGAVYGLYKWLTD